MTYRVKIEETALADLKEIVGSFTGKTELDGPNWYDRLIDQILTLETFPMRCPIADVESERTGKVIRYLLYGRRPHSRRLLFEIEGSTVFVLHVTHGARDH